MKRPNGPRNLKAGGFTNGLWRLEERQMAAQKRVAERARRGNGTYAIFARQPSSGLSEVPDSLLGTIVRIVAVDHDLYHVRAAGWQFWASEEMLDDVEINATPG